MADYDLRAQQTAGKRLAPKPKGKGQAVTLTYREKGEYDIATQSTVQPDPVTQNGSGIEESYEATSVDGKSVLAGDSLFMLSPNKIDGQLIDLPANAPETATLTLADGTVKKVVRFEPFRPAGVLAYAYLQLRGAG